MCLNVKDNDDVEDEVGVINFEYQEKFGNGVSIGVWIGDWYFLLVSFGGMVMVDDKFYGMIVYYMLDDLDCDFGQGDVGRSMVNLGFEWFVDLFMNSIVDDDEYGFELFDFELEMYLEMDIMSEYDEDEDYEDEEFVEFGDIFGIEFGCGDGYIVIQLVFDDVDEGFFFLMEIEDEDYLDIFSLGEVYVFSGICWKNVNGLVYEVDWVLF